MASLRSTTVAPGAGAATPATAAAPDTATAPDTDGRRLRRDRNREAVVRALLALYHDGNLDPSIDEIAARSGVSARSVFRYFDDVGDLANAAITHQLLDVAHLTRVDATPGTAAADKIAAVATQRAALFEAIASAATVSRLRAPFNPVVAERLAENRALLRQQLAELFAPELGPLDRQVASARLAAADAAASFESWQLWRHDHGLTARAAEAVLREALACMIGATR